jgi:hypothetical protein
VNGQGPVNDRDSANIPKVSSGVGSQLGNPGCNSFWIDEELAEIRLGNVLVCAEDILVQLLSNTSYTSYSRYTKSCLDLHPDPPQLLVWECNVTISCAHVLCLSQRQ